MNTAEAQDVQDYKVSRTVVTGPSLVDCCSPEAVWWQLSRRHPATHQRISRKSHSFSSFPLRILSVNAPTMPQYSCSGCGKLLQAWGSHRPVCPKTLSRDLKLISVVPSGAVTSTSTSSRSGGAAPAPPIAASFHPCKERILRRIPHGARPAVRSSLQKVLQQVATKNDSQSWFKLLSFCPNALRLPEKVISERSASLATAVKRNLALYEQGTDLPPSSPPPSRKQRCSEEDLVRQVGQKIDDGSISGAMRVLLSTDSVAACTPEVLQSLREKHPLCPPPTTARHATSAVAAPTNSVTCG
ncbi:uncharacterized protein LOC129596295 isoform X2 [Paramacrobiotus metropolitanus]|uniref:uncharacterized protein LOC129596295 isoform X2 n=1 Tax=Paramacrobiotus metropolitanus TaxID=2943436 RepID=UPI0024464AA2|nr:uncharacterized protein LOC129596295 isoform X2 [Paramacrobiotus metropolitanus]